MHPIYERFMGQVEVTNSCWNWTGTKNPDGTGRFHSLGHRLFAHRVSYMLETGRSTTDIRVTQTCGNKACVNPAHLVAHQLDKEPSLYDG